MKRTRDKTAPRITIRVDFAANARVGPGKIALLEAIRRERSISAAARALGMSYRRAWLLVDNLNEMFEEPVVETYSGRTAGGGTVLTAFGERLVALYRSIERQTERATNSAVEELVAARRVEHRGRAAAKRRATR
jgi:molybdate transport system regulatory protein